MPSADSVADLCKKAGYEILNIGYKEIINISSLTYSGLIVHKDPFDKLLISVAKTYGYTFLTADKLIPGYNETCIMSC